MKAVLLSDVAYVYGGYRPLCPQERILLRHMMDRGRVRTEEAINLLWGHREDGGPLGAEHHIYSILHYIRRRLKPGWILINRYRKEWHLVYRMKMDMAA